MSIHIDRGIPIPKKAHAQDVPDLSKLPPDALLTRDQVAALSGFAVVTLKVWAPKGRGPKITYLEGRPRFKVRDVREWMEAGQ